LKMLMNSIILKAVIRGAERMQPRRALGATNWSP
jgi:hypothetical protein